MTSQLVGLPIVILVAVCSSNNEGRVKRVETSRDTERWLYTFAAVLRLCRICSGSLSIPTFSRRQETWRPRTRDRAATTSVRRTPTRSPCSSVVGKQCSMPMASASLFIKETTGTLSTVSCMLKVEVLVQTLTLHLLSAALYLARAWRSYEPARSRQFDRDC